MSDKGQTPSQTIGPYFSMRLFAEGQNVLVAPHTAGRIRVEGRVLDGDRKPVEDALVELWQANGSGRFRHPADRRDDVPLLEDFTGFGRASVNVPHGEFWFETIKPGRTPGPRGSWQAPHLSLVIQARGMIAPTFTRLYFPDEAEANSRDFLLERVPAARRATLIADKVSARGEVPTYRFEVRYQGSDETVFFDF